MGRRRKLESVNVQVVGENQTAFRQQERRFRGHVESSDVVDFTHLDRNTPENRAKIVLLARSEATASSPISAEMHVSGCLRTEDAWEIYGYQDVPGLAVIPNPFRLSGQRRLVHRALSCYHRTPNATNLDAHWEMPRSGDDEQGADLWTLWKLERQLRRQGVSAEPLPMFRAKKSNSAEESTAHEAYGNDRDDDENVPPPEYTERNGLDAHPSTLMRKLRWTTLGLRFDWYTKQYICMDDRLPFPPDLAAVAKELVDRAGPWLDCRVNARGAGLDMEGEDLEKYQQRWQRHLAEPGRVVSSGIRKEECQNQEKPMCRGYTKPFYPEAGIVNYYQVKDRLTGHVDRSEQNMEAPLVSLSFGHACIFLLGGPTRDHVPVVPILLRSGDVLILSGEARRAFHGVPKIVQGSCPEELLRQDDASASELEREGIPAEEWQMCQDFLRTARINMNVRQVFFHDGEGDCEGIAEDAVVQ